MKLRAAVRVTPKFCSFDYLARGCLLSARQDCPAVESLVWPVDNFCAKLSNFLHCQVGRWLAAVDWRQDENPLAVNTSSGWTGARRWIFLSNMTIITV